MFLKFVLFIVVLKLILVFLSVNFLSIVGFYAFHSWCFENFESIVQIAISLCKKYVFPSGDDSIRTKYGHWAVVTGSTDGIGLEYAKQLASQGVNIVLISRSSQKLDEVASKIESDYGVETKCIVVNFNGGKNDYHRIERELNGLPVGILVNCVGRMYDFPDEMSNVPIDVLWSLINMNIGAMITMTRIIVNGMKERNKGAIVNISSGSELQPAPYITVYAATKVFVRYFTLGLQQELKPYGITVQLLSPYCVQTKLHTYPIKAVVSNIFFPSVEKFARSAIFTLGKTNETTGYWAHAIMNGTMRLLPVYMRTIIMSCLSQRVHQAHREDRRNSDTATEIIDN